MSSVYFTNANIGWVVGHNGAILKTTTGGVVVSVEESKDLTSTIPNEYELSQNYPNPFNRSTERSRRSPETEIRFQLPKAGHVVMKIFNTIGKEIRTLVDAEYQAGYHRVHCEFWISVPFTSAGFFRRSGWADKLSESLANFVFTSVFTQSSQSLHAREF